MVLDGPDDRSEESPVADRVREGYVLLCAVFEHGEQSDERNQRSGCSDVDGGEQVSVGNGKHGCGILGGDCQYRHQGAAGDHTKHSRNDRAPMPYHPEQK